MYFVSCILKVPFILYLFPVSCALCHTCVLYLVILRCPMPRVMIPASLSFVMCPVLLPVYCISCFVYLIFWILDPVSVSRIPLNPISCRNYIFCIMDRVFSFSSISYSLSQTLILDPLSWNILCDVSLTYCIMYLYPLHTKDVSGTSYIIYIIDCVMYLVHVHPVSCTYNISCILAPYILNLMHYGGLIFELEQKSSREK